LDVAQKQDLMITCKSGVTIRMKVSDISEQGRATQGVKLIRLDEGDEIAAITRIDDQEQSEGEVNGNNHVNGVSDATDVDENPS
jgi:DNA gyrase subunit A